MDWPCQLSPVRWMHWDYWREPLKMQESIKMKEIFFSQTLFVYPCFTANKKKRFEFNMEDVKKKKPNNNIITMARFLISVLSWMNLLSVCCAQHSHVYSLTDAEVKSECRDIKRTKNPLCNSCEYLCYFHPFFSAYLILLHCNPQTSGLSVLHWCLFFVRMDLQRSSRVREPRLKLQKTLHHTRWIFACVN